MLDTSLWAKEWWVQDFCKGRKVSDLEEHKTILTAEIGLTHGARLCSKKVRPVHIT